MKVTVEFEDGDDITKAGIVFLAGRAGETIEEYAKDALLCRLAGDEESTRDGYFENLRQELAPAE